MPESRLYPRQQISSSVAFQVGNGPRIEAVYQNLSLGGMYVETSSPAPYGTRLRIFVALPGLGGESVIEAVVRWTKPSGMGVQFGLVGARETYAITQLIAGAA